MLSRLEACKRLYGDGAAKEVSAALREAQRSEYAGARDLIRLHETALFLRAYPHSAEVARLADAILFSFAGRVTRLEESGGGVSPFAEGEVSGIAGTRLSAVFSYETARRLSGHHALEINWDEWDTGSIGSVLRRFLPLMDEDWPVEAHVPYRDWMTAARAGRGSELGWLLERFAQLPLDERERSELFDSLRMPVQWELGDGATTRSRLRLPRREPFYHREPLLRRSDVSLRRELDSPPLPVTRVARAEAERVLAWIVDTSAMRYRELYGFNHPDSARVFHADLGRGVEAYFFGIPPEWRLPLRAYHCGAFFKNGVPAGYIEVLSLFERAEVGFNLYYTFREGESAWIYARLLRLLRQMLGVTCFSVDPYQIGHQNPEAIDSGAFWFYRKLGFRPLEREVVELVAREERRMAESPGYRSSRRALEKLARGYISFEGSQAGLRDWDRFRVRNVGMAAQGRTGPDLEVVLGMIPDREQWTEMERAGVAAIVQAKRGPDEARYLRLMQKHRRLREAVINLGEAVAWFPPSPALTDGQRPASQLA
jgi:hypothetical protein